MLNEFKEFINKGNVVTTAVAFILGLTFKPVIDRIVDRVVMPFIGLIVGQPNFDTVGTFACEEAGSEAAMAEGLIDGCAGSVGAVITVTINFLLVALVLFFIVRAYNRMQRKEEEAAEDPGPSEIDLLTEIRDNLAK